MAKLWEIHFINAVKQNDLEVAQDGIEVIINPKTINLASELLSTVYDKTSDLINGRLLLTISKKASIKLYECVKAMTLCLI